MLIVGAKTGFGQNCPKMDIFYKLKSQKLQTTKKFPILKRFRIYDFHIDFQFWTKKSLPRDLQMVLAIPRQSKWSSTLEDGSRKSMNDF